MYRLLVLIISTVINAVMVRAQSDIFNTTCTPFRLLVIWHTSNGEDAAFIEQKRLIIHLLLNIPQGTEIHVTAIGTQRYHLLHFKKNETTDWMYNISMYNPEILENHNITDSLINETVFSFRKQNYNKEVAELTVLVVSEKTLTENSLETIKNKKTCVVFTGLNPPPALWTSLATDRQHVVKLNTTTKSIDANIKGTANTVLDLLCRDSRLICDTDEFWTGKRCVNCSNICSADTKQLSDICPDACPYYKRLSLQKTYSEADKKVTVESDYKRLSLQKAYSEADKKVIVESGKPNSDRIFISIILLLSVLTTVALAAVCVLLRRVRMLKQRSPAYLGRTHPDQETSRTDEQIDLRVQQEILHLNS